MMGRRGPAVQVGPPPVTRVIVLLIDVMTADGKHSSALERETLDLVRAATEGDVPPGSFRELWVQSTLAHLERGRSILLVGSPGVGKTALVYGLAHALAASGSPATARIQGLRLLALGHRGVPARDSEATAAHIEALLRDAAARGVALHVPDLIPAALRGRAWASTALDALQANALLVIEATPEQLRALEAQPQYAPLCAALHVVHLEPLTPDQCTALVTQRAHLLGLSLTPEVHACLRALSARFAPAQPAPGPELRLLGQVHDYREQKRGAGEDAPLDAAFVEKVFAIYAGLPLFLVSNQATQDLDELRDYFIDRLVGQREAIEAVVDTIATYKAGLQPADRPVCGLIFSGPSGVGRGTLVRLLAGWLFGSPQRVLRFDGASLTTPAAVSALLGDPGVVGGAAPLLDPVEALPPRVLHFDAVEDADPSLLSLLHTLLTQGELVSAAGRRVNFRQTIVVLSTRVGAQAPERGHTFGLLTDVETRAARLHDALSRTLRPDVVDAASHWVSFHALTPDQLRQIARAEARAVLSREGPGRRGVAVDVDDAALELIVTRGYDPLTGARGLLREVNRQLVTPLAGLLVERDLRAGTVVRWAVRDAALTLLVDTPTHRGPARAPLPEAEGATLRRATREDLVHRLRALGDRIEALARLLDETALRSERDRLSHNRPDPAPWRDASASPREQRALARCNRSLALLLHLRERRDELLEALPKADTRERLRLHEQRIETLDAEVSVVWRELWVLGRDGEWDTLLELTCVDGDAELARRVVLDVYLRWASARDLHVEWVCEPRSEGEPLVLSLSGRYPHGYLRGDAGLHRVRDGEREGAVLVRVVPITDTEAHAAESTRFRFLDRRALKATGLFGGAVRSRLGGPLGFVLQNDRTLADNEALAQALLPSWLEAPEPSDAHVRTWDLNPARVSDALVDEAEARPDAAEADGFHELLCRRADLLAQPRGPRGPEVA